MRVKAFRGATQLLVDSKSEMEEAVCEMLTELFESNGLATDDLISILFTATPDLVCDFPAAAARKLDLGSIPLICAVEIAVPGSMPKVVRAMVHAHSELEHSAVKHVYLRGAQALRKDLAQ